jgi:hypothetical protein
MSELIDDSYLYSLLPGYILCRTMVYFIDLAVFFTRVENEI